jgi:hypothetical protein
MKRMKLVLIILLIGITACAQQSVDILMRKSLPKITLTGLNGTAAQINLNGYTLTTSSGLITLSGASFNLGANSLLGSGSIGTNLNRFSNAYFINTDFSNAPTIQGVSIFNNPPFTGTINIPNSPVNANDAVNKSYVDARIALGLFWVAPCEDIVSTLANSITIGKRYILSTNNHIYTSNGDNTWTDGGATSTGTTSYVKTDASIPANSVGPYNFNGSAWVSIGISGNHNDLSNIQGGTANQYYHLTANEYTFFQSIPAACTIGNLPISDGTHWQSTAVPTWNQNTSGTAAKATILETTRTIFSFNFNGSQSLSGIIPSTYGGTANGFTKFSGPATSEKTFTLPNASSNILTDNTAVTVQQGGTGRATSTTPYGLIAAGTSATGAYQTLPTGITGQMLLSGGTSALPSWSNATYPLNAGTPGYVPMSDGTNLIMSPIPGGGDVTQTGSQTLTNKTLTLPKINEDVQVISTATDINALHNGAILNNTPLTGLTNMDSLRVGGNTASTISNITIDSAGLIFKVNGSPIQTYIPPANRMSFSTAMASYYVDATSSIQGQLNTTIKKTNNGGYIPILPTGAVADTSLVLYNGSIYYTVNTGTPNHNYYVSNTGNDANTGLSSAQAWQTLSKVNGSTFQPGDNILFKKGDTWDEALIVPSSGTISANITFGSYGTGANPIFDGQNTRTDCISDEGVSYITIDGIDTKNATEFGVVAYDWNHTGSHDFIIKNSIASYNAQGGICLYIDNCSAINCTAHHNGTLGTHHGINVEGHISSDGLVTADNWLITDCTSYNNAGYGFQSYVGGGGTLSYCKAYLNGSVAQSGGGAIISTITTSKTVNVYYNIFYSNIFYGIAIADNTSGDAINVYNNTIYDNCDVTYGAGIILKENNSVSAGMIKVKNNLVFLSRSLDFEQTENTTPYTISNNLYYRTSGNMIYWNSLEYTQAQFAAYKTASGDATSLSASPAVTNAAGYDFSLQAGSPCINAGVSVGLTRDYFGNLLVGLPDIGAIEKQ